MKKFLATAVLAGAAALAPTLAHADNILFVSDVNTDNNLPGELRAAGHTVTVVINDFNTATGANPTLAGSLTPYDAVYWSATGDGFGSVHSSPPTFTNLTNYVNAGGRVFVTGYDSIASPMDATLITFLGGSGSVDRPSAPAAITAAANSLNTGVVDIRSVVPAPTSTDRDALTGLAAGTIPVSGTAAEAQWTLRTLGSGQIAYVSNGDPGPTSANASWTTATAGGAGAYRAAALNFAFSRRSRILFVSDVNTDNNIPGVLQGMGHRVTTVINDFAAGANPTLSGSLAAYDIVYWSATGDGFGAVHSTPATFTNLTNFANGGGRVFVTGYDSIASPPDPNLVAFLGGAASIDSPGAPTAVNNVPNVLNTGVVDIRGVVPAPSSGDRDALTGLMAGTIPVSGTAAEAQWTLRTLGRGQIAYVSNGDVGPISANASWTTTTAGGAGAYNAAIRNFSLPARGRVLFVSDVNTDNNIPGMLTAAGYNVTTVLNDFVVATGANPTLQGYLGAYSTVVWSATGEGFGTVHSTAATFTNLNTYVTNGGRVFVTGYDSIASPPDPNLIAFLGGAGSIDIPGAPAAITSTVNTLNTGVVDLRGVVPAPTSTDRDALTGLMAGTIPVSGTAAEAQWTLRTLGSGQIAYVSNGDPGPTSANASWTTVGAAGAGAYNGSLRNFVANIQFVPALAANGTTCMTAAGCASGNCVDGVCCNTSCGGGSATDCQACNSAGAPGTCGPLTAAVAPTVTCRASAGACDAAETCTAGSTACPADALAPAATTCRASAGTCDVAETCTGSSAACPADAFAPAATTCRASAGTCDVAETCTGSSAACPADGLAAAGTMCRASAGACDIAEACDGAGSACPADAFAPATMTCRPALGACDTAENCSGAGTACPTDVLVGAGTECRASAGPCDIAEACDGVAGACPADALRAGGTSCRGATGACDVGESCDGVAATCPADTFAPDGTACNDTLTCNGAEVCAAGACGAGTAPDCNDNDPCTTDSCAEPGGCAHAAIPGCGAVDAGTDAGTDAGRDAGGTDAGRDAGGTDASATDGATGGDASRDGAAGDATRGDAAGDGGTTTTPSGCGCTVPGSTNSGSTPAALFALVGLSVALSRRRRRAA